MQDKLGAKGFWWHETFSKNKGGLRDYIKTNVAPSMHDNFQIGNGAAILYLVANNNDTTTKLLSLFEENVAMQEQISQLSSTVT